MRVYISGPISGKENCNREAFNRATAKVSSMGYVAVNPMLSDGMSRGTKWEDYIRKDIVLLSDCDGVALLPGWNESRGARLEVYIAYQLGMFFIDAVTGSSIKVEADAGPSFIIKV